jgi:hypothetical protein
MDEEGGGGMAGRQMHAGTMAISSSIYLIRTDHITIQPLAEQALVFRLYSKSIIWGKK